ncbi:hypothetical protein niasHS_001396 [Heterodera schachtii]|uniref:Uncharacterized protein n=1 Tax=Heterodera schachtii TaxID=97005 RepID=A0ABD2KDH0_HETSC
MDANHIENLTLLAPSMLCECPLLHSITTNKFSLEFTAKDGAPNEGVGKALAKWLHIANPEGLPKMIHFCYNANGLWTINKSEEMKDAFYLAKTYANFIVRL